MINLRIAPTSRWLRCLGAATVACLLVGPAWADAPNYQDLFRSKALKCIHPTLTVDKATLETIKGPETSGEVTTVRLKVYYEGWMKKNVMESDLLIRQAGSIRQMRVKVLSDTGAAHKPCALESNWADF